MSEFDTHNDFETCKHCKFYAQMGEVEVDPGDFQMGGACFLTDSPYYAHRHENDDLNDHTQLVHENWSCEHFEHDDSDGESDE